MSRCVSVPLTKNPSAPARSMVCAVSLRACIDSPRIRSSGSSAWMRVVASMPSMCGIATSMRMTSGRSAYAWAIASKPLDASPTTESCGC